MNKKGFVGVAGAILLLANIGNSVNASSQVALTHNAYVYDQNGHRVGRIVLKKNQSVTIVKTKKINGKQYVQIGKNRYIKKANYQATARFKPKAGQTGVVLAKNAYIYDEAGNTNKDKLLKGTSHQVYQVKWIKGKIYYMIGANQWVKGSNVASLLGTPIYPENTKSESLNTNSTTTSNSSNTNSSSPVVIIQNPTNNAGTSSNNGSSSNNHSSDSGATDYEDEKPYKLTHVVPVYDESGQHILGAFGYAGNTFFKDRPKIINGQTYYRVAITLENSIRPWSDDDPSDPHGYISESSLTNDYKLPTPASRAELIDSQNYYESLRLNDDPKLNYANNDKKEAYHKAIELLHTVAINTYSTSDDIAKAKNLVNEAINQLDGVEITVKHNEKLTPEKKVQIEQQVNRINGVTDAQLSSNIVDDNLTISYTSDSKLIVEQAYNLRKYVNLVY